MSAPTTAELGSLQLAVDRLWALDESRRLVPGRDYQITVGHVTKPYRTERLSTTPVQLGGRTAGGEH